jgi:prevent-host-death family protein
MTRIAPTSQSAPFCTPLYTLGMATTISITEARASLPDLIDRVAGGEEITLTRHGSPVAVLIRPDALRSRRADAAFARATELREGRERARHEALDGAPGLTEQEAEELIAEIRSDRDRR